MKSRHLRLGVLVASLALTGPLAACGASSSGTKSSTSTTTTSTSTTTTSTSPTSPTSSPSTTASQSATTLPTAVALGRQLATGYKTQSTAHAVATDVELEKGIFATIDVTGRLDDSVSSMRITTVKAGSVELRKVGGKFYVKGDRKYWIHSQVASNTANLLSDKWFLMSPKEGEDATKGTTIGSLLAQTVGPEADNHYSEMTVSRSSLDGTPVYGLTDTDRSMLLMTTTTPALPLEVVPPPGEAGAVTFSDWGKPVSITAPPNAVQLPSEVQPA